MMELIKIYLDPFIFGLLGLMSFILLWMIIERLLFFKRLDLTAYAKKEVLEVQLTQNLTLIATIGSNAPYVGLFGTVLGIMVTFADIAASGQIDAASIMLGLALALKATAAGIGLAIPAMMAYNLLDRKAEVLLQLWHAQQGGKAA